MRISDWSSDVCSSDLSGAGVLDRAFGILDGLVHRLTGLLGRAVGLITGNQAEGTAEDGDGHDGSQIIQQDSPSGSSVILSFLCITAAQCFSSFDPAFPDAPQCGPGNAGISPSACRARSEEPTSE